MLFQVKNFISALLSCYIFMTAKQNLTTEGGLMHCSIQADVLPQFCITISRNHVRRNKIIQHGAYD